MLSKLRPIYPDDREFEGAFAEKTLQTTSPRNKKVVCFILFALEKHVSGNAFEIEDSQHTIEHVLPENPSDDWYQFDGQQQEAFTYRLGNMTILRACENRELGNLGYDKKRLTYQKSGFDVTKNLADRYD
ncbi:MAG: HNH endonuclease [Synechococcus sp. SB0669_bin_8]|nr:HNH endonuclease [Synechococcus sp. SB0669_bin_8]